MPKLILVFSDDGNLKEAAGKLQIAQDSKILLISTEGDTDPVRYQHIVWDGAYPYVSD